MDPIYSGTTSTRMLRRWLYRLKLADFVTR